MGLLPMQRTARAGDAAVNMSLLYVSANGI